MVKIPYKVFPHAHGGYTYAAMLAVNLALPNPKSPRSKRFEAIIDSGAHRCMFHSEIGRFIGLDVTSGVLERTSGIGGVEDTYLHEITLYIPGGTVVVMASFKENLPVLGLLGMNGFFDHFTVTFDPAALTCNLDRVFKA